MNNGSTVNSTDSLYSFPRPPRKSPRKKVNPTKVVRSHTRTAAPNTSSSSEYTPDKDRAKARGRASNKEPSPIPKIPAKRVATRHARVKAD